MILNISSKESKKKKKKERLYWNVIEGKREFDLICAMEDI